MGGSLPPLTHRTINTLLVTAQIQPGGQLLDAKSSDGSTESSIWNDFSRDWDLLEKLVVKTVRTLWTKMKFVQNHLLPTSCRKLLKEL